MSLETRQNNEVKGDERRRTEEKERERERKRDESRSVSAKLHPMNMNFKVFVYMCVSPSVAVIVRNARDHSCNAAAHAMDSSLLSHTTGVLVSRTKVLRSHFRYPVYNRSLRSLLIISKNIASETIEVCRISNRSLIE